MTHCLINGEPADLIRVTDRGLQYGDGVFETLAVQDGRVRLLDRHLQRLGDGCRSLGIAAPEADTLMREIARVAGEGRCVVKLIVTRGDAGRGYGPAPGASPTRICRRFEWPVYAREWHRTGIELRWCETRLALQPALAGHKHLNRLEQVLARAEWSDPQVPEGLMRDMEGYVVSGTQSNLFVVHAGTLLTAAIDRCGVRGVMRAAVLEAARREGIEVRECRLDAADVGNADEAFLTSAVIGIWPVVALGERCWPIGAMTRRAQEWLAQW